MSRTPSAARSGRRRTLVRLAPVLALTALLSGGCDARELYEDTFALGFPEPITEQGESIYELWLGSMAAATVVGVFVLALIGWAVVRYRKRTDELPRQVRYNLPVEVLYTFVPIVIIAVLFYYTVVSQNFVNRLSGEQDGSNEAGQAQDRGGDAEGSGADVNIGVVGFQWNWQFNYVDEDVQVTGETDSPALLVLPTGRTIRFVLTSPDVIHSFFVPTFLFKRDVIPGRANEFEITLTKEGEFIGRCAEFCGEKHAFMNFAVRVVSPEEYDEFIAGLEADPDAAMLTTTTTSATDSTTAGSPS